MNIEEQYSRLHICKACIHKQLKNSHRHSTASSMSQAAAEDLKLRTDIGNLMVLITERRRR